MSEMVRVLFKDGTQVQVEKGTTFETLFEKIEHHSKYPVMLVQVENAYKELASPILHDLSGVRFIHLDEKDGMRVYQRSATFLLVGAAKRIKPNCKIIVNHYKEVGYLCE